MDCYSPGPAGDVPPYGQPEPVPAISHGTARLRAASTALAPAGAVPAHLQRAAAVRGMNRYRVHIGDLIVELRYYPRQTGTDYHGTARRALLLVPLTHDLEVVTETTRLTCPAGASFLFARNEVVTAVWHGGSWALAVHLRPERLNAAVSAVLGDARRLRSVAAIIEGGEDNQGLAPMAQRLIALIAGATLRQGPAVPALESSIYRQFVDRLLDQANVDALLAPVRAVGEAMRVVRENPARPYDTEALAAVVGVTAPTLRKGFRARLGMSVKEYIQMVRLDRAHEWLTSGHESRPISEIGQAAGFQQATHFSRAYMKRFGEPPSQTRARAVRAGMA